MGKKYTFQPAKELHSKQSKMRTPKEADSFTEVTYLFGRELQQRHHEPIGLIQAAWSGKPRLPLAETRGRRGLL